MAEVQIINKLDRPIHVAVVRHGPQTLDLIVSPTRVPIPSGTVLSHWDVEPNEALKLSGIDDGTAMSLSIEGCAGMGLLRQEGRNADGPYAHFTLCPPSGTDDSGSGEPDPTLN